MQFDYQNVNFDLILVFELNYKIFNKMAERLELRAFRGMLEKSPIYRYLSRPPSNFAS